MEARICQAESCSNILSARQAKACSRRCSALVTKSWLHRPIRDNLRTWSCAYCGAAHRQQNQTHCSLACKNAARKQQIADQLVDGNKKLAVTLRALVAHGFFEAKCAWCGLNEWRGKTGVDAPLQIDHINGRAYDNRIENLRILCANCHTQTDTFCGRNRGNGQRNA